MNWQEFSHPLWENYDDDGNDADGDDEDDDDDDDGDDDDDESWREGHKQPQLFTRSSQNRRRVAKYHKSYDPCQIGEKMKI